MASVYRKESGVYYISVMFRNKRITRSLGTHSYNTARKLIPKAEQDIFTELFGLGERQSKQISFSMLVKEYLNCTNQPWADNTRIRYRHLLYSYIDKGLPDKPTTRAMTIRTVNACNNWGFKNGFIDKPVRLKGGSKWEARNKVFRQNELNQLIESIECPAFNRFVRFAYYTGARSGEIRSLRRENIKNDHIVVNGKTGPRMVKLNSQAKKIIKEQNELWNYSKDFVSHKFKKECRKLGIKDARFHDLRRTFGYNLVKQGMSIFKVSKLLGHSSVRTTEKHYAPLLTTDIEEFVL